MHSGKIKLVLFTPLEKFLLRGQGFLTAFTILSVLLFFQKPIIAETKVDTSTALKLHSSGQSSKAPLSINPETNPNLQNGENRRIDSYFRYMPSRSVDAQSGKVEILEADTEYSYEFKAFDKLPLKLSLDNKYIGIENTTSVKLPAHLVGLTTDIETSLALFNVDKTSLHLGVSPSFYADDWSFRSSGFRLPSRAYLIYQPTDKWTFLAGVAFYPDFENEVLPILGFIYKPNDKLTFEITPKRPNISYILNGKITLFAEGGSTFNEFEVTKDNLKNVVLRYRQTHLGAGIKYKVNKFIESSLSCGGIFGRSLKYRDNSGKVKIKNGAYTELRLEIKI